MKILFCGLLACCLAACASESKKGNLDLVRQMEAVAKEGCACQDVACLHNIRVEGKSVIAVMRAKLDDLTAEEKKRFYKASNEYMKCESALNQKQRKP